MIQLLLNYVKSKLLVHRHTMKEYSTPIEALSYLKTIPGVFTCFLI